MSIDKEEKRFSKLHSGLWKPALWGFVAALAVALPTMIKGNDFFAFILSGLLFLGITLVVMMAVAALRHNWRVGGSLLLAYGLSLCFFWFMAYPIHDRTRWTFQGSQYKAAVLSEADVPGELRHVRWEVWGGMGAGHTASYLVFDPTNSLAAPARNHTEGKIPGVPCEVWKVHRFSSQWYTVTTYTDTDWDQCK